MKRQIKEFNAAKERMNAAKETLIKAITPKVAFAFDLSRVLDEWVFYALNTGLSVPLDEILHKLERTEILTLNEFKKLG